jgi:trk system potassium uptake protein TrkA
MVAVVGLGLFGRRICLTLSDLGLEVLAIDRDSVLVDQIKNHVTAAVCTDVTEEAAILDSGILSADQCVVAIGENMESSILVTALLKKLGVKHIIARAHSDLHAQILRTVGAERTVDPEDDMGVRLAEEIYAPDVHARIRLSTGQEVVEVEADPSFFGRTIQDLNFRQKYRLNIIAIKSRDDAGSASARGSGSDRVNKLPRPDDIVMEGDVFVLIGDSEMVRTFLEL